MVSLVPDLDHQVDPVGCNGAVVTDPDGDAVTEPEDLGPPAISAVRYSWRDEDEKILRRIEATAVGWILERFGEALGVVDEFYARMRVRAVNEHGVALERDGRPVWQVDPATGKVIERLDQLTGQDYDMTILRLQRILLDVAPEVNRLALDATFAQHYVARDAFDDGWIREPLKSAQNDKRAKANIYSRQDRYHSFFRFYLHLSAKTLHDELQSLLKRIENIRYRQFRDTEPPPQHRFHQ